MNNTQKIVNKAWSFAHVLRDDGLSYLAYTEQITFLLFLKMADELANPPHNKPRLVPIGLDWPSLLEKTGENLIIHYRLILERLGNEKGNLGTIFKEARADIHDPSKLRRLIVDLIDKEEWVDFKADVKGDIYEGLLSRSAAESPSGAGQYFTPRPLIQAIVDVVQPTPSDTIADPAAGTGGFLTVAHDFVTSHFKKTLTEAQESHLRTDFARAWELVPNTARLCLMNLYLHGMDGGEQSKLLVTSGVDSLKSDPAERFTIVLANPPFGKKTSFISSDISEEDDELNYNRQDFWVNTKNKQLNFLQHIYILLKPNGTGAVVVPDNVLYEGGAGEIVRRNLLELCNVHTILRMPTGIFYKPGVKASVIIFSKCGDKTFPTEHIWFYDARTNLHYTPKEKPLKRNDFDEFVKLYNHGDINGRIQSWSESNENGRWRMFSTEDVFRRDGLNLDIVWIDDDSLIDMKSLPDSNILAMEIADELQSALDVFAELGSTLKK